MIDAKHYPVEIRPWPLCKAGAGWRPSPTCPAAWATARHRKRRLPTVIRRLRHGYRLRRRVVTRFRNPAWVVNPGDL